MGVDPERRTERNFIIGTRQSGWKSNPIGLRVDIVHPKEIGDEPRIAGVLLWNAQIRTVWTGGDVTRLKHIFAGYEFFPFAFTSTEIIRLEDQLKSARDEYIGLIDPSRLMIVVH